MGTGGADVLWNVRGVLSELLLSPVVAVERYRSVGSSVLCLPPI